MRGYLNIFVVALIVLVVLNLVLLVTGKISEIFFWVITAIMAVFAYAVLPRLRKKYAI
jgi:hypothetical protein